MYTCITKKLKIQSDEKEKCKKIQISRTTHNKYKGNGRVQRQVREKFRLLLAIKQLQSCRETSDIDPMRYLFVRQLARS